jgi:hypothetical protein
MINKSKLALTAAMAVASIASPASAEYMRNWGSLLYAMARRFYDARMEKAQMRLAPTRRVRPRYRPADFGSDGFTDL